MPAKGRRETKLTPALQKNLCDFLVTGNYFETACRAVGIHPATAYRWLEQADDDHPEGIFRDFREAVTRASAEAETNAVNLLMAAAAGDPKNGIKGDPRAATELLKRRWGVRWGDVQKIKVEQVAIDQFSEVVLQAVREGIESNITDPELRRRTLAGVLDRIGAISRPALESATGS